MVKSRVLSQRATWLGGMPNDDAHPRARHPPPDELVLTFFGLEHVQLEQYNLNIRRVEQTST